MPFLSARWLSGIPLSLSSFPLFSDFDYPSRFFIRNRQKKTSALSHKFRYSFKNWLLFYWNGLFLCIRPSSLSIWIFQTTVRVTQVRHYSFFNLIFRLHRRIPQCLSISLFEEEEEDEQREKRRLMMGSNLVGSTIFFFVLFSRPTGNLFSYQSGISKDLVVVDVFFFYLWLAIIDRKDDGGVSWSYFLPWRDRLLFFWSQHWQINIKTEREREWERKRCWEIGVYSLSNFVFVRQVEADVLVLVCLSRKSTKKK